MLPSRCEVPCDELPSICHTLHCTDASAQKVLTLSLCQLGHCDPGQPCLAKISGAELLLSHGCRRSSALRLSLSSTSLASRGAEAAEGAAPSSHAAQRRRRHRRNGSFVSLGYPAAQPDPAPCRAAAAGNLSDADADAHADAHAQIALRHSSHSERTPKSSSAVDRKTLPGISAGAPVEAAGLQTVVSAGGEAAGPSVDAMGGAHARDSAATELPDTWVSALHSTDSMDVLSEAIESLDGPAGAPESSRPLAGMVDRDAFSHNRSSAQAASSLSAKQRKSLTHQHRCAVTSAPAACQDICLALGPLSLYLSYVDVWPLVPVCVVLCFTLHAHTYLIASCLQARWHPGPAGQRAGAAAAQQ